jgi:hypothetical protein
VFGTHAAEIGGGMIGMVGATAAVWAERAINSDKKSPAGR